MLNNFYDKLQKQSPVAVIIIAIAIMLLCGFLMTRITKKLKLPNVTAYIVTGILIGPFCLNLIPQTIITGTEFLADIALAFIAFSTGEFFKFSKLKNNAGKVVIIALAEALTASLFVFILTFWILRLNLAFSIVLAALASATAPASTMMTIRQTQANCDFRRCFFFDGGGAWNLGYNSSHIKKSRRTCFGGRFRAVDEIAYTEKTLYR